MERLAADLWNPVDGVGGAPHLGGQGGDIPTHTINILCSRVYHRRHPGVVRVRERRVGTHRLLPVHRMPCHYLPGAATVPRPPHVVLGTAAGYPATVHDHGAGRVADVGAGGGFEGDGLGEDVELGHGATRPGGVVGDETEFEAVAGGGEGGGGEGVEGARGGGVGEGVVGGDGEDAGGDEAALEVGGAEGDGGGGGGLLDRGRRDELSGGQQGRRTERRAGRARAWWRSKEEKRSR